MDSRFTQKGKIWRDFADDDDSNDAGVADSGSEDGSDNNDGLGDYEEKLKTWGHNDGTEDEDWKSDEQKEVHVANEKKRAEDKDQKKKKEKEKKIEKGKDKASARTAVDKNDKNVEEKKKEGEDEEEEKGASSEKRVRKSSALRKDAEQYRDKLGKRGVLYLSRVPRKMNPDQARTLLEEYGEITRIYLAEEDASAHKRRAASGGSATRHFIEGWVEFANKSIAKRVAASLNNSPISMRKGNVYVDERWNLKYLSKFKWDFLTEKLAYERRVREAKLKASMMLAKKGNAEFAEAVEKNKGAKAAQARIEKKRKTPDTGDAAAAGAGSTADPARKAFKRTFKQTPSLAMTHGENSALIQGGGVLGKVWGKR